MRVIPPTSRSTQRVRSVRHIATSQTIPGMRSCPSRRYPLQQLQDQARMVTGYAQVQIREQQRRCR